VSGGLKLFVKQESVAEVQSSVRDFGRRVIRAILFGMREAMDMLGAAVAGKIHSRTGKTAASVLQGVRATETTALVVGRIGTGFVGAKPVGIWLERGTSVPSVSGKLMVFEGINGTVFTRKHAAFRVPARPVFNPTLQGLKEEITARIQARMDQVLPT
jgi:hypothetical protein